MTTVHDPLAAARSLRPLVEAHAHSDATPVDHAGGRRDRGRGGLYGALVPKELGGLELSIEENLDIIEEIAYADGSTAWTYLACATTSAFFGAWCEDGFVRVGASPTGSR